MPWVKIPPERLADLPLFGIDLISDQGDKLWYRGPNGRMLVEKKAPRVWFDDIGDAHQCGATAILIVDCGNKN